MLWAPSWPATPFLTQSSLFVYSGSHLVPGLELCPGHKCWTRQTQVLDLELWWFRGGHTQRTASAEPWVPCKCSVAGLQAQSRNCEVRKCGHFFHLSRVHHLSFLLCLLFLSLPVPVPHPHISLAIKHPIQALFSDPWSRHLWWEWDSVLCGWTFRVEWGQVLRDRTVVQELVGWYLQNNPAGDTGVCNPGAQEDCEHFLLRAPLVLTFHPILTLQSWLC